MKKFFLLISFFLSFLNGFSQTGSVTLTFIGENADTHNNLPLESVYIQNTSYGGDTTIYGANPSLVLKVPLGISEQAFSRTEPFIIRSPVPNPFTGTTWVEIELNIPGPLQINLCDAQGKVVSEYKNYFKIGIHKFQIESSLNSFLLLNVSNSSLSKSIRLINKSYGMGENSITYLGIDHPDLKLTNSVSGFTFRIGDQLLYKSIKSGYYDEIIIDSPKQNSSYTFELKPIILEASVITAEVINITQTTAKCGGNVTSDGGAPVTARGVCWSASSNPSTADSHTINGIDTGTFVSNMTGLTGGASYHVRAYATNSAGTSYGNELTFTTLAFPTVTTDYITNITETTAISGGMVTSDGGAPVTARGICWSTSSNPTTADNQTINGSDTGTFVSNMTSLTGGAFYYVRAYATNSAGTSYGNELTFTTLTLPAVTTETVTNINETTAISGGTVSSDGGASVTSRGICWSISATPTTADSHTLDSSGTGTFISIMTGLSGGTFYYVRAYATNNVGTSYGNEIRFITAWLCGFSITVDHEAGLIAPVNKTVTYGTVTNIPGEASKCWITSNLGADHQAISVDDPAEASAGWYWQFNRKQGYKHDGTTRTPNTIWISSISENFDWQAANDPCSLELGVGWRIPTATEWTNVDDAGGWTDWNGPWNSDLKLHAAGHLSDYDGYLSLRSSGGSFWSSTQYSNSESRQLGFNNGYCYVGGNSKAFGFSLRCIKE